MSNMVKLKDICIELSDGLHAAPIFSPDGEYLFVNANNLIDGKITDIGNGKRADYSEYLKYRIALDNNTILYSIDGTIGKIAKYNGEKCILGKGACYIRLMANIDRNYIYYVLQSELFSKYIKGMQTGSTIHHISLETMRNFSFPLPPYEIQRSIGKTLSVLDEKIDNNQSICRNIDKIIKLLYDYWFVQFDFPDENGKPYKSSCGKMVWNEELKQEIPDGWTVDNLYGIGEYINGLACQKFRPIDDAHKIPVIKITEIHDGFTDNTEFVRDDIESKYIIHNGDILFSWSASLEVVLWCGGTGGLNQHIFKVLPKVCSKNYVYMQLKKYIIHFVKIAEARKTTMGHITTDHLEQSRIVIPPEPLLMKFQDATENMFNEMIKMQEENNELKSLRDFLLPMLMNGQIKIR